MHNFAKNDTITDMTTATTLFLKRYNLKPKQLDRIESNESLHGVSEKKSAANYCNVLRRIEVLFYLLGCTQTSCMAADASE